MAPKFRRSSSSLRRRNSDYVTDNDASPSQSSYASNEDDATESSNSAPSDRFSSKALEIKGSDFINSPNPASNTATQSLTALPYMNVAPLPIFHGRPDECPAMHLSRFFKVCRANNASSCDMMMRVFPVTLENEAALWYDLNIEPYPLLSWEEIKASFLDAYYRVELKEQLRDELMTINQGHEETVRSYFLRLQLILKKWPDSELSDGLLRAIFIDGLREDFKGWIVPQKPPSLNEALRLAFGFEHVRSVRPQGKRLLRCGFCEGAHEEQRCEVRDRMRELWKRGKEKNTIVDMAESDDHRQEGEAAELVRSLSMVSRNGVDDEKDGGETISLKKKSQCQCGKHKCWKKKLDRSLSTISKNSNAD